MLYATGECDVYTADASALAATRAKLDNPEDHTILPETVSKEPLGPLVRHGDHEWGDVVRWTLNALIAAEEMGVTSTNISDMAGFPFTRERHFKNVERLSESSFPRFLTTRSVVPQ
mgnify:CR=1 FL=1